MESTEEKENPRKEEEARQPVSLSDDLVMEILIRLPFRAIVRFQCVSKSWRSLTSNARKKLPRSPHGLFHSTRLLTTANDRICFVNILEEAGDIDTALSFLPPSTSLEHVDVCNGLVLCRLQGYSLDRPFSSHYAVSNPATRKYAMLPPYDGGFYQMCWLAFDPDVSLDYNVLSIVSLDPMQSSRLKAYQVAIFSSKDREWVVAEHRIELDSSICQIHSHVFFNGVLYLLVGVSIVLGFNLQGKVCRRFQLPPGVPKLGLHTLLMGMPCFGVYGGCLQIAGGILGNLNDEMSVWVLKDMETKKWVLKHKSSVQAMEEKLPSLVFGLTPKFMLRSFHFNDDAVLLTAGNTLFCYDLSTTYMTEVCALRDETHNLFYPYTPYYSEGLVSTSEDAKLLISSEVDTT